MNNNPLQLQIWTLATRVSKRRRDGQAQARPVLSSSHVPGSGMMLTSNGALSVTTGQITAAQVPGITGSVLYEDANTRMPSVPQWTLDIQHTFGRSYLLDVAYLGNEGHHLAKLWNPLDCSVPGTQYCNTATEQFYPRLTFMQDMSTIGSSNYNALLVKFIKQFSNGFSLLANYTWSKAMSNSNESNNGTPG
jgi:hypothetical protein